MNIAASIQTHEPSGRGAALIAAGLVFAGSAAPARAKEGHLERVKTELISLYVQCTACHVNPQGDGLNGYGRGLADMGGAEPLAERVARMERRVSEVLLSTDPEAERGRVDMDGDGALNWVEMLCGTDPSNAASVPSTGRDEAGTPTLRERVESVVSCTLCHTRPAAELRNDDAPHNPFGQALERLGKPATMPSTPPGRAAPGRAAPPSGPANTSSAPEPPDIWERMLKVRSLDTDHDRARNWDEIATFHHPADEKDVASEDELKKLRDRAAAQRHGETGYGRAHAGP